MPAGTDQQAKPSRVRTKKLYATGVAHPAVFSEKILPLLAAHLDPSHSLILDPFAGVGKIHRLPDDLDWTAETVGVEIEQDGGEGEASHAEMDIGPNQEGCTVVGG